MEDVERDAFHTEGYDAIPENPFRRVADDALSTFSIDVDTASYSNMRRLPLLQRSMKLLVEQLGPRDRVALVVYAGSSGLVLPSTSGDQHGVIAAALDRLSAGGSTHGSAGIELAYQVAREAFLRDGVNRVILCTDGDFNVGITDRGSLLRLIEDKRRSGVFLSVLGFGTGNLKDDTMELLADKGNGNYAYVDSLAEARKMLVEQAGGTLEVIAKDVKIQVEFNPAAAQAWRLIGYENRVLAHQDFHDDTKDAGEIGAGIAVTALYEVVPHGVAFDGPAVDESRYQTAPQPRGAHPDELLFVKLRSKQPDADTSSLLEVAVKATDAEFRGASENLRFAAAVAGFAMLLRQSAHAGSLTFEQVLAFAQEAVAYDPGGYRREFLLLVQRAREIAGSAAADGR